MWKAYLKGHAFDLEALSTMFDDPSSARVVGDADGYHLCSPSLEALSSTGDVRDVASQLLARMNGLARINHPSYHAVELSGRFDGDGSTSVVVESATMEMRSSLAVRVVVHDGDGEVPPAPRPDELSLAAGDTAVDRVLRLLADDGPDWVTLYKVYEVIRADAGGLDALQAARWTSKGEAGSFTASANHVDASGDAARHAVSPGPPPSRVMDLEQGRAYIRSLAQAWIASKHPPGS